MKVIKRIILICLFCFWLLNFVKADILPENSHRAKRCITIENPNVITWYKLVLLNTSQYVWDFVKWTFYLVETWSCLPVVSQCWWSVDCESTIYLIRDGIDIDQINPRDIKATTIFENNMLNHIIYIVKSVSLNYLEIPENRLWVDFVKFDKKFSWWGWVSNTSKMTYESIKYKLFEENWIYKLQMIQRESDVTWKSVVEDFWNDWEIIVSTKSKRDNYAYKFLKSRLLTITLETIVLIFFCKLFLKQDNIKNWRIIFTGIFASTCTLPILWFILPHLFHDWTVFAISGEIFVTIVEVVIIKYMLNIKRWKAIMASITCNLFSVLVWLFL